MDFRTRRVVGLQGGLRPPGIKKCKSPPTRIDPTHNCLTKGRHRMATLGLIGSGRIGGTVARLAGDAGYDVVLSNSRRPETLAGLGEELGPHAPAATPAEAAEGGQPLGGRGSPPRFPGVPVAPP